jgi:hypothetical protein
MCPKSESPNPGPKLWPKFKNMAENIILAKFAVPARIINHVTSNEVYEHVTQGNSCLRWDFVLHKCYTKFIMLAKIHSAGQKISAQLSARVSFQISISYNKSDIYNLFLTQIFFFL